MDYRAGLNTDLSEAGRKEDIDRLLEWLISSPVRSPEGALYAWIGEDGPSFKYPEVTAYFVKLCVIADSAAGNPGIMEKIGNSVDYLVEELEKNEGRINHNSRDYVFDTAMVLSALVAVRSKYDMPVSKELLQSTARFIVDCLIRKKGVGIVTDDLPDRWSTGYNPHLLKVLPALCDYNTLAISGDMEPIGSPGIIDGLIKEVLNDFVPRGVSAPEFFSVSPLYTHAFCYALEGLIGMRARNRIGLDAAIINGVELLSQWQNEDGSWNNWQGAADKVQRPADATAQAIRLFIIVDPVKYENNIKRGIDYLKAGEAPGGGLYYSDRNMHQNACATIFAVQAFMWNLVGPDVKTLV
ncbi:MAG: hypothetical protein M1269_01030 [Chloroflexi bacterium]|nr:hypothetical protein [Chloroflexota bacterium]